MGGQTWIPYHIVACSSEEPGTSAEVLSQSPYPSNRSWESKRACSYPQEIIVRLLERCDLSNLLVASKQDKNIPEVHFYVGDGMSGSFLDVEYKLAGKAENITEKQSQIKLIGIGTFVRIQFVRGPHKSAMNPLGQVSLSVLKFWGRPLKYNEPDNYETKDEKWNEKSKVDKLLIELGMPIDLLAWFEEDDRNFEYSPIDEDTKQTLKDLHEIKERGLKQTDFELLKQIVKDIKEVFNLGQEIWTLEKELEFQIAKENYEKAIQIKKKLAQLRAKRDNYDAIYETSRYENMIQIKRPNTALEDMERQFREEEERERERERLRRQKELDELERQRLLEESKKNQQQKLRGPNDDYKAWYEKNGGLDIANSKKKKNEKKTEKIEITDDNPFAYNEGDKDLDKYFKPLFNSAGGNLKDVPIDLLRKYQGMGILNIFGAKVWTAVHSENWRLREAAAQAVLLFMQSPLPEKYSKGKTKKLFMACLEMARLACEDQILQIYFIGLKILSASLAPPVCGKDITPQLVNKYLKEFIPFLIEKVSELNFRARDISLHTLISLFKHPSSDIVNLLWQCLDICELGVEPKNPKYVTPDKRPWRIVLARLEIILQILQEHGYDPQKWEWSIVFIEFIAPCLFHQSPDVRMVSIEIIVKMYSFIGEDVRIAVNQIPNLKPLIQQQINERLDEIDQKKNGKQIVNNQKLSLVLEANDQLEYSPTGTSKGQKQHGDNFNQMIKNEFQEDNKNSSKNMNQNIKNNNINNNIDKKENFNVSGSFDLKNKNDLKQVDDPKNQTAKVDDVKKTNNNNNNKETKEPEKTATKKKFKWF